MHGIGNDFVLIDTIRDGQFEGEVSSASIKLCNRAVGIGADGLIFLEKADGILEMKMFNPDGSESEMCGNGLRAFAKLASDRGYGSGTFPVKTGAGILDTTCNSDGSIVANMGMAILDPKRIGMVNVQTESFVNQEIGGGRLGTAVSMGNPHLIILVDDVSSIDLENEGSKFERHAFFPHRVNVSFVQVISRSEITVRTWERGAGATLACGTGACASAVAAHINGKTDRRVAVNLPGGSLVIEYLGDGTVQMTGQASYVFEGTSSTLL